MDGHLGSAAAMGALLVRTPTFSGRLAGRAHVEADVEHVAVLDDVRLALEPLRPALRRLCVRAGIEQVVPADHLAADESAGDVGVDRAAGLDAVWPSRRVQARVSFSPAVKNVIKPSASFSRCTTSSSAEGPVAKRRSFLVRELDHSASSLQSIPPGPVDDRDQRFRRQRVELAGARPSIRKRGLPASRCASTSLKVSASRGPPASPDFACFSTRSSRLAT